MVKPINTKLDRLNITGQKDPNWLYSGAVKKDVVNDLDYINAIGEPETISRIDIYGVDYGQLPTFETGKPWEQYTPVELSTADYGRMGGDTSIFDSFTTSEFWTDLFRDSGKSAERDQYEMGLIGNKGIASNNLAAQKLMPTPRSAQESTKNFSPKGLAGNVVNSLMTAAAKLVSGAASGGNNSGDASQGNAAGYQAGNSGGGGTDRTALIVAAGIGVVAMGIIGTIIIVRSKANK